MSSCVEGAIVSGSTGTLLFVLSISGGFLLMVIFVLSPSAYITEYMEDPLFTEELCFG